jgi:hypothetical protein
VQLSAPLAFHVDATRPVVADLQLNRRTLSAQTGHRELVVDFTLSEPLGSVPLEVTLGDVPLVCDLPAPTDARVTCGYTVTGDEPEGVNIVAVRSVDDAGNESVTSTPVVLDFAGPGIAAAFVSMLPGPGNPLSLATRATVGSVLVLVVTPDEALDAVATPTLDVDCGGRPLASGLSPASLDDGTAVFRVPVPALDFDGVCVPSLRWTDVVQNPRTVTFASPALAVKTSTPTLRIDQTAVRFLRAPWGRASSTDGLGAAAEPLFALLPAEAADATATTLPATTFALDGERIALVQVWADPARRSLLATVAPNPDGTWPRVELANLDTPTVYVTGVDDAGNASAPVAIENAAWVATLGGKRAGLLASNPHRAIAQPAFSGSLRGVERPYLGSFELDGGKLGVEDGDVVSVAPAAEWVDLNGMQMPVRREYFTLAYDSWRGVTVLHGGYDLAARSCCDVTELGDTWFWDGARWAQRSATTTEPRVHGAQSVFDPVRGVTVLFGGRTPTGQDASDVWEFDGVTWRHREPLDPEGDGNPDPASYGIAMTFDHASGRVAMRAQRIPGGGNNDRSLWFWDGTSWEGFGSPVTATLGSEPFDYERLTGPAYDPVNDRLLHLSNLNPLGGSSGANQPIRTWEWTGTNFRVVDVPDPEADGVPLGLLAHATSVSRGEIIALERYGASTVVTWRYDGTSWRRLPTTGGPRPVDEYEPGFVYDASRDVYVLVDGPNHQETWEFDGATWRRRMTTADPVAPVVLAPFSRPTMYVGYDPLRNVLLRNGSVPLAWVDRAWYPLAGLAASPCGLQPCSGTAWPWIAEADSGRLLEFSDVSVHRLEATGWTATPLSGPFSSTGVALPGDDTCDARLITHSVRLPGDGLPTVEVWALQGNTWTRETEDVEGADAPDFDFYVGAWNPLTEQIVTTDVVDDGPLRTWTWTALDGWGLVPTVDDDGDGEPGPLHDPSLFFDERRKTVVLFGGYVDTAGFTDNLNELWQWTGRSWLRVPTVDVKEDGEPSGRPSTMFARDPRLPGFFMHGLDSPLSTTNTAAIESWLLGDATAVRPAVVLDFDVGAAELGETTVLSCALRVVAGAARRDRPDLRIEPEVRLWERGEWVPGTGDRTPDGNLVAWTEPVPVTLLRDPRLRAAVIPAENLADDDEHVLVDAAELTIRYRVPPESPRP